MELLFFLAILLLQFGYQIIQEINKKKLRKKAAEKDSEDSMSESFSETPEEPQSEPIYSQSGSQSDPYQIDQVNQSKSRKNSDLYNQIFGFVLDQQEDSSTSPSKPGPASPAYSTYGNYDESINLTSEDQYEEEYFSEGIERQEFAWDREQNGRAEKVIRYQIDPTEGKGVEKSSAVGTDDYSRREQALSLNNRNRILRQIRNPQTLRDAWRTKFILDRPLGYKSEYGLSRDRELL